MAIIALMFIPEKLMEKKKKEKRHMLIIFFQKHFFFMKIILAKLVCSIRTDSIEKKDC